MRNKMLTLFGACFLALMMAIGSTYSETGLGSVYAQPAIAVEGAKIVITAPTSGVVGELIRMDVSKSQADSFKWLLVPESVDFEVYDNGRRAVFSARETGSYMFIVACAKDGMVDVATHVVTITQPGEPDPNKEYPKVDEPVAGSGLNKLLPYWCSLAKRAQVETLALAESFESVAAAVAAGVYTTPKEISKATGEANQTALGPALESWMPVLSKLQTELRRRSNAGELKTPEQHAAAWREIAEGLLNYAAMFNPR
jgi:hypothetical protein